MKAKINSLIILALLILILSNASALPHWDKAKDNSFTNLISIYNPLNACYPNTCYNETSSKVATIRMIDRFTNDLSYLKTGQHSIIKLAPFRFAGNGIGMESKIIVSTSPLKEEKNNTDSPIPTPEPSTIPNIPLPPKCTPITCKR